ncbi:S-adenosyl-L-methionine-dependent methyltransferase, partial [Fistulina hepatica ATCC 64428]
RVSRLSKAFLKAYPFDSETTVVMDFACGTGLVSRALCSYARNVVGVDISPNMVDEYNRRVMDQGIPSDEMHAVLAHIDSPTPEGLENIQFDVIVCAASYHHFPSIEETTVSLARFLKTGGVLMVADLLRSPNAHEIFDHGDARSEADLVAHPGGFEEGTIRSAFEMAGLKSIHFGNAATAKKNGHEVKFFIATGVKS